MIEAGFEFAFGVFLFLMVLWAFVATGRRIGRTARKFEPFYQRHRWQVGIGTAFVVIALLFLFWRMEVWYIRAYYHLVA